MRAGVRGMRTVDDNVAGRRENGGVTVTPDVISVIVAIFVAAVTFLGGVAGLLSRQDKQTDARFDKIDARFDKFAAQVDTRFDRVDARFERVEAEIAAVRSEVVDVKIAVARLEGPPPRLLHASR
ncbi:hypothetical protein ET475_08110 [Microbacterium protaetiae]|uniref:Response regulator n=1 Tax=Microbacterium protaetiae TaxID=2509458 RepID=A0A4P6EEZ5_9MICO|nr:hypothetical protein [Microbacterium protaetiae]QAY59963.1 hypothetical protein ET475_08110 [Microbacterium protaetiae]